MDNKNLDTIYELYNDYKIKPNGDCYLKPFLITNGINLGIIMSGFIAENSNKELSDLFILTSYGLSFGFLTRAGFELHQYLKDSKHYKLNKKRIKEFNKEANIILGREVDLSVKKLVEQKHTGDEFITIFENALIKEEFDENNNYSCKYLDASVKSHDVPDLSCVIKKVYNIKK